MATLRVMLNTEFGVCVCKYRATLWQTGEMTNYLANTLIKIFSVDVKLSNRLSIENLANSLMQTIILPKGILQTFYTCIWQTQF
jgi:hypothetical protein